MENLENKETMIKTKDLEKFAEDLGDEVLDLNCNYT